MAEHNIVGQKGEEIAVNYLTEKGYKIIKQNWRFQRAEIDIIAQHSNEIVIVEVKTRSSKLFENPKEAVTKTKQRNLIKAADAYIQEYDIKHDCRFDIVSIIIQDGKVDIEHLKDAFQPLL